MPLPSTIPSPLDQSRPSKGPRACITCAKAKARCIPGPPGPPGLSICERCHRLSKPCGLQTPAPPRPKKASKPTRVSELEKRLDNLTAQLQAAHTVSPQAMDDGRPTSRVGQGPEVDTSLLVPEEPPLKKRKRAGERGLNLGHLFPSPDNAMSSPGICGPSRSASPMSPVENTPLPSHHPSLGTPVSTTAAIATPATSSSTCSSASNHRNIRRPSPIWPSGDSPEAAKLLANFIATRQPLFPFVVIPPNITVSELSVNRPLLFRAVMMAELFWEGTRQMAAMQELMELLVAASFLGRPRKNLDLLQALELVIAWMHFDLNGFQLTNFLFLARSLCVNMTRREGEPTGEIDEGLLEQVRAFTGVYYLNTYVFTTNKRADSHMDIASVDSWCAIIEKEMALPSDSFLLQLMRIQMLSHSISLTISRTNFGNDAISQPAAPLEMVILNFQHQIQTFKAAIPPEHRENVTLNSHMAIAEALLYEVALSDSLCAQLKIQQRLDLLWRCTTAIKVHLGLRFPPNYIPETPQHPDTKRLICLSSYDFAYAILTSLKLLIKKASGWNRLLVAQHLGLMAVIDTQIREMDALIDIRSILHNQTPEAVATAAKVRANSSHDMADPFERLLNTLRNLRVMLEKEMERIISESSSLVPEGGFAAADEVVEVSGILRQGITQRSLTVRMSRLASSVGIGGVGSSVGGSVTQGSIQMQRQQQQEHQPQQQQQQQQQMQTLGRYDQQAEIRTMGPTMIPVNLSEIDGFDPIFQDLEESLWGEFAEENMWVAESWAEVV